jgi:glycosyltransferase involved in cell wall biosynthesis
VQIVETTRPPRVPEKPSPPPLISIITVVLNAAGTLERTIESVVRQSFANYEFLVIDGGSTDGTLEVVRKYESSITYWCSEPDRGLYDAMNKGVRAAKGQWLLFLGADDILVGPLSEIAPLLSESNTIYYGDVYMPARGRVYDGAFNGYKLMFANICQQAIFYPRRVFDAYSFDTRYKLWADHVLNMACYGDKRFRFKYIAKLVAVFNDSTGASAKAVDAAFLAERETLIKTLLPSALFLAYRLRMGASRLKRWCLAAIGIDRHPAQ